MSLHTAYIIYVTIEETTINPTAQQALACVRVCQWLSNCYKDVQLFRFDAQTGDVYKIKQRIEQENKRKTL